MDRNAFDYGYVYLYLPGLMGHHDSSMYSGVFHSVSPLTHLLPNHNTVKTLRSEVPEIQYGSLHGKVIQYKCHTHYKIVK